MPNILGIETTGPICSVALFDDRQILQVRKNTKANEHSSVLHLLIQDLLSEHPLNIEELDAIALSAGPGSYTGLRIGSSSAKGLCLSIGAELIGIPTHYALLHHSDVIDMSPMYEQTICLTDARRDDAFISVFDGQKKLLGSTAVVNLADKSTQLRLNTTPSLIIGSGAEKAKLHLSQNHRFHTSEILSASNLHLPSVHCYEMSTFESIYHFEPRYEKEFYTTHKVSS